MPITLPHDETTAWLALLRAPGLGAVGVRELVAKHGGAASAIAAADARIPDAARTWLAAPDGAAIERDLAWLEAPDHHLVTALSEDFPLLLRGIPAAPAALFVVGDPTLLWTSQIAVVGARNASAAGRAEAARFARAFAETGTTVTSGLAEGIDGAAHAAALDSGGTTIAVLGTGPDVVYPRRHRIISGVSLGTLVVEAGLNSGSLITARLAAEQGREVFAIPGSIHHALARGCHRLIRDGARLVEAPEDVLAELGSL